MIGYKICRLSMILSLGWEKWIIIPWLSCAQKCTRECLGCDCFRYVCPFGVCYRHPDRRQTSYKTAVCNANFSSFYRYANIVVTIKAAFLNRSAISLSKKGAGEAVFIIMGWVVVCKCLGKGRNYKRRGNNGDLGGPFKIPRVKLKSRKLSDRVYVFSRLKIAQNRCNGLKHKAHSLPI